MTVATPPLLGTDQTAHVLRHPARHRRLLGAAESDVKRQNVTRLKPGYLVDFQELHIYIYQQEKQTDTLTHLEYLFDQPDLTFIIGPGTLLEIIHRFHLHTGIDFSTLGALPPPSLPTYDTNILATLFPALFSQSRATIQKILDEYIPRLVPHGHASRYGPPERVRRNSDS